MHYVGFELYKQVLLVALERTTCIKGQKWTPLKLVYLFLFCSSPHADYKIKP